MRQRRYEYLTDIINIVKPETIIEIGVARGENAQRMIQAAGFNVEYTGFDVFDNTDKEWHKLVGNGKGVLNEEQIKSKLEPMCSQVSLVKGFTQETLWAQNYTADLVFIDGDHRSSMIIGDHKADPSFKSPLILSGLFFIIDFSIQTLKSYIFLIFIFSNLVSRSTSVVYFVISVNVFRLYFLFLFGSIHEPFVFHSTFLKLLKVSLSSLNM